MRTTASWNLFALYTILDWKYSWHRVYILLYIKVVRVCSFILMLLTASQLQCTRYAYILFYAFLGILSCLLALPITRLANDINLE